MTTLFGRYVSLGTHSGKIWLSVLLLCTVCSTLLSLVINVNDGIWSAKMGWKSLLQTKWHNLAELECREHWQNYGRKV